MRNSLLCFAALLAAGSAAAAEVTVYKQQNFGGDNHSLRDAAYDLSRVNFHDQISSIVVHSGAWEVCTQPQFRGDCVVLKPGSYAALETRINHRIESMREAPPWALDRAARESGHIMIVPPGAAREAMKSAGIASERAPTREARTFLETAFEVPRK
jgi:hypothetical protein